MWSKNLETERQAIRRYTAWAGWLLAPAFLLGALALYAAFLYAPTEKYMGDVQRIFYFHVGSAWNAFLAFFVVFLASIAYLRTRRAKWDQLAAASTEVGVVFTTITLVTGSLWAKPIWFTWWPWGDPRVTTTLVLWLMYVAYLILRSSLPEGDQKYKFCAVLGIVGFINVPIVWMSIRWWRTHHPVVITSSGMNLEARMVHTLLISVFAFAALYATLLCLRTSMRLQERLTQEMEMEVLAK
jgi:heme exporter protein C